MIVFYRDFDMVGQYEKFRAKLKDFEIVLRDAYIHLDGEIFIIGTDYQLRMEIPIKLVEEWELI